MINYFKDDIHKGVGNAKELGIKYRKVKGYRHTWDYFYTEDGINACSMYRKDKMNMQYSVRIRNSLEGWKVTLGAFIGGRYFTWHYSYELLEDAIEQGNEFLDGKLVLKTY